jgi:hypothetical protein
MRLKCEGKLGTVRSSTENGSVDDERWRGRTRNGAKKNRTHTEIMEMNTQQRTVHYSTMHMCHTHITITSTDLWVAWM